MNKSEIMQPPVDEKPSIDQEVIDWIKEKLEASLKLFDEHKHWTKPLEEAVKDICLISNDNFKLFVWLQGEDVHWSTDIPHEIKD